MQSIIRLTLKIKTDATVIFQKCFPMIFFFLAFKAIPQSNVAYYHIKVELFLMTVTFNYKPGLQKKTLQSLAYGVHLKI